MRALLSVAAGGPETLAIGEIVRPLARPGQVVIEVRACAVNYPDYLVIADLYQSRPSRPFAPGGEVAGIVSDVGEGVSNVRQGDRVIAICGTGGMAEAVAVGVADVYPLPDQFGFAEGAALLMTYGTGLHALQDRASLAEGETLLVLGAAGGVGIAAIEIGKALGARVVAGVSSEARAEAARQAGADAVVVYGRPHPGGEARAGLAALFKAAVGAGGANVIFDPVGGPCCEPALRAMAWGGRYLVIGFAAGIPSPPLNLALLKGCDIVGVFWGAFAARAPQRNRDNIARLFRFWEQQKIRPLITETFSLADGGRAIGKFGDRSVVGKLVVEVEPR